MNKLSIYLIVLLTIFYGSIAHGAEKLELDTKTTLSIINTVMDLYYTLHRGNEDEIQAKFLTKQPIVLVKHWIDIAKRYKFQDKDKLEFRKIGVSPKNSSIVSVYLRLWNKEKNFPPPYNDDLIILKRIGSQWKIMELTAPNLP